MYVPVSSKINTGIESGLQQLAPNGNDDFFRHQIIETIKKSPTPRPNLTNKEKQAITELLKDNNITTTEAEKGKATVIMNTPDFLQLVNKTLSDKTTYQTLQKDPIAKLEHQHKKTLKDLHHFITINSISASAPLRYRKYQGCIDP
ncbi:uncharacterized protein LOC124265733 [Haliotis rubra]|uniref:uncharacterized protein LOC124265733 n=1 Tax=Haliotis rubra TaxID=36100 RepID=UPI001EE52463|nr:uncharacterized protein LOC124265733 [Haliotis rubra]